ncbi:MAG: hypothetical protein ACK5C0_12800 [Candidatus Kapaibacterium sp.]|jgi:hypothetical protein
MNIVVILNYVVRIMTIVLGVLITIKPWDSNGNSSLVQAFGVVTIAFGLFRLYTYHKRLQELKRQEEQTHSENEHDDEETKE